MKTIATYNNGIWICTLGDMELFRADSVDEVYKRLDECGLFPYYPHEFHA